LCRMKNKATKDEILFLLNLFLLEQSELGARHVDSIEIKRHFLNWLPINLEKHRLRHTQSTNKLLGD